VESWKEAKIICSDAQLERLLSIYQSFDRQGLWKITNNIFAEKTPNLGYTPQKFERSAVLVSVLFSCDFS